MGTHRCLHRIRVGEHRAHRSSSNLWRRAPRTLRDLAAS
jgi:hypothetical protein